MSSDLEWPIIKWAGTGAREKNISPIANGGPFPAGKYSCRVGYSGYQQVIFHPNSVSHGLANLVPVTTHVKSLQEHG